MNVKSRAKKYALIKASKGGARHTFALVKRKDRKVAGEVRVLNLNAIMVVTTITDEEKKQAYKTGRIAEMSLKPAGLQA